jgi:hypothetical protein
MDYLKVGRVIDIVKTAFKSRFPGCPSTTTVLIWDDDDFSVELSYGDEKDVSHCFYYKNEDSEQGLLVSKNTVSYRKVLKNGFGFMSGGKIIYQELIPVCAEDLEFLRTL